MKDFNIFIGEIISPVGYLRINFKILDFKAPKNLSLKESFFFLSSKVFSIRLLLFTLDLNSAKSFFEIE